MNTIQTTHTADSISPIVTMVLDTVGERTKRDYSRALTDFMVWYTQSGHNEFNKAAVNAHVQALKESGVSASSINQRLSALRKLALESADNGLIEESTAQAIRRTQGVKKLGKKSGNWLTQAQASEMVNEPDKETVKGKRDRAILAIMIGCGLRREEVVSLTVAHLQQRDARWVILDLEGKHGRVRTVPMASWVKMLIDEWLLVSAITEGVLFPPIRRGGKIQSGAMTPQAIWKVVAKYSPIDNLAPHDLRRTFAKLAHKAGSPIEQIQQSLGHASIKTTEDYIGVQQDLQVAPSDLIKLDV